MVKENCFIWVHNKKLHQGECISCHLWCSQKVSPVAVFYKFIHNAHFSYLICSVVIPLLLLCCFRECSKKAAEQAAAIVCLQSLGVHDGRSKAETTWDQRKVSPDHSSRTKYAGEPMESEIITSRSITQGRHISLTTQKWTTCLPKLPWQHGSRNNITVARLTKASGQREWDIGGLL